MVQFNKVNSLVIALLTSSCVLVSHADIEEIPAEEMTEAYIKDTTVIIPKSTSNGESGKEVSVKVQPNQGNSDSQLLGEQYDPNNQPAQRPDLKPLSDENLAKHQADSLLLQNSQVNLPVYDPSQKNRDENLRKVLTENNIPFDSVGVPKDGPIDYSKLQFPTGLAPDLALPEGIGYNNSNPNQFIISIPNRGFNAPAQNQTPNGDYQIQVDSNTIQLIINNPNR